MSEYQYYEFRAADKPLNRDQMEALRDISSRAEISSTCLTNEYHFGNFRGNPLRLMEQYFDAHLYYANWGTRHLMLRLPLRYFPMSAATPYAGSDGFKMTTTKEHVILQFEHNPEDSGDEMEDSPDLAGMLNLRAEIGRAHV